MRSVISAWRNKPEGRKTALAGASLFTSRLLEIQTWTCLLPVAIRNLKSTLCLFRCAGISRSYSGRLSGQALGNKFKFWEIGALSSNRESEEVSRKSVASQWRACGACFSFSCTEQLIQKGHLICDHVDISYYWEAHHITMILVPDNEEWQHSQLLRYLCKM